MVEPSHPAPMGFAFDLTPLREQSPPILPFPASGMTSLGTKRHWKNARVSQRIPELQQTLHSHFSQMMFLPGAGS